MVCFHTLLQVLILNRLGRGASAVGVKRRTVKRVLYKMNCTKGITKSQGELGEKSGVELELIRFREKTLRNRFASPRVLADVESVALISGGQPPSGSRPSPREVRGRRNRSGQALQALPASG